MSNNTNTNLIEEAREWADVYVDTTIGNALLNAIKTGSLESMYYLVQQARQLERETWGM